MTNEEALKIVEKRQATSKNKIALKLIECYAIKKQIKTKPYAYYYRYSTIVHTHACPACGEVVSSSMKYCKECGQALDWGK